MGFSLSTRYALLVALVLASAAHAVQSDGSTFVLWTLRGAVIDTSGAAVPNASITISQGCLQHSAVTDHAGLFQLDLPFIEGEGRITATGFEPREFKVDRNRTENPFRIVLSPATVFQSVAVTAGRASRVADDPADIQVITQENISTSAAITLDDTLRQVPGFNLFRRTNSRTANPTSQGVSLRGLGASGASRALVLRDGVPLNDPFGGWVYWDRIPRTELRQIEILRGGASNLYGTDALGGVIQVLTPKISSAALDFETFYGGQNSPDGSIRTSGRLGNWGGAFSGEAFSTDGYINVARDQRGPVDTPVASSYKTAEVVIDRNFASGHAFVTGDTFGEDRNNGTPLQTNATGIRELRFGADWKTGREGSLAFRGYGSDQRYRQSFSSIAVDRASEALARTQQVPAQQGGASLQWSALFGRRNRLLAGADGSDVRGETREFIFTNGQAASQNTAGGRQTTFAWFADDALQLTSRSLLRMGLRFDHWSNFDALTRITPLRTGLSATTLLGNRNESFVSPKISLLQRITSNLSVNASGYRAFRAPTLNELYRSFRLGNVLTQANSDLRAEHLTGAEAGILASGFHERLWARANYFWAEVQNPIANVTLQSTPALVMRQRQNLGRTQSQGVELQAEARITSRVFLSTGYQFVSAIVKKFPADPGLEGLRIPQVPRHQFTLQTRWELTKQFSVSAQARASSTQFEDDRNQFPLRKFFDFDIFLAHRIGRHAEVYTALQNIAGGRIDIGRTPVLMLGEPFLARAGLRLHFGGR